MPRKKSVTKIRNERNAKLPKVIRVADQQYRLEAVPDAEARKHNYVGLIDYSKMSIGYRKSQTDVDLVDTILHESIHAIDDDLNIGLSEKQVVKLGNGLTELIASNPAMFRLFLKLLASKTS